MKKSKFACFMDSEVLNLEKVKNLVRGGTGGGTGGEKEGPGGSTGGTGSGGEEGGPPPVQ